MKKIILIFTIVIGIVYANEITAFSDNSSFLIETKGATINSMVLSGVQTTMIELVTFNNYILDASNMITDETIEASVIGEFLAYPSKFSKRTGTTIGYRLAKDTDVEISVYNLRGYKVYAAEYMAGFYGGSSGYNKVPFTKPLDSGVYIMVIVNNKKLLAKTKIMVLP